MPDEDIRVIAAAYLKGEPLEGELAVITRQQADESDYNLSPSRWAGQNGSSEHREIKDIVAELLCLDEVARVIDQTLSQMLVRL